MTPARPATGETTELEEMRAENARLRAELYGESAAPPPPEAADEQGPVKVLLVPDPNEPAASGKLGPVAIANLTRTTVGILRARQPGVVWRVEHELEAVPEDSACHQLGEVAGRFLGGKIPATYFVERRADGDKRLRRVLVDGERDSDRFSAGYAKQLQLVDDMIREAEAAHDAEAQHHAHFYLLALDVVLARLNLALALFTANDMGWRAVLAEPRPEWDPLGSPP